VGAQAHDPADRLSVPVSLTDLAPGHEFAATTFTITPEAASAYREATAAAEPLIIDGATAVPPMAVAALALGALLREVSLPAGSLHAAEALEFHAAVPEGATVECRARLVQRSVRAGWVVSVLATDLYHGGAPAVSARATVMSPAGE
jgi:hypothetical protein